MWGQRASDRLVPPWASHSCWWLGRHMQQVRLCQQPCLLLRGWAFPWAGLWGPGQPGGIWVWVRGLCQVLLGAARGA